MKTIAFVTDIYLDERDPLKAAGLPQTWLAKLVTGDDLTYSVCRFTW